MWTKNKAKKKKTCHRYKVLFNEHRINIGNIDTDAEIEDSREKQ